MTTETMSNAEQVASMTESVKVTQAAREAVAKLKDADGAHSSAECVRRGDWDDVSEVRYALLGARAAADALRHQPQEREAVLEEAARRLEREWPGPASNIVRALKTTPAPAVESDWFAGAVDCDGNELVTIRADELQKLRDEREKFMWQVRDTCTRAEKAERALKTTPAPIVSRDEIVALLVDLKDRRPPDRYDSDAELSDRLDAILSRLQGEGE